MIEGNQLEKVINVGASDDGNLSYVTLQVAGAGNVRLVVPKEQASTLLSAVMTAKSVAENNRAAAAGETSGQRAFSPAGAMPVKTFAVGAATRSDGERSLFLRIEIPNGGYVDFGFDETQATHLARGVRQTLERK
ncbi:MAG: hypothetical protein ABJO09_08735 [Hyphomicrobiales bacterium]